MIKLDVRTKILLLIVANVIMFMKINLIDHLMISTIFAFFIVILYDYKRAIRIYTIYLIFTIYEMYFSKLNLHIIIDNFMLLSSLIFKTVFLPICAGIILVGSSKVSELITFLRKIKVPSNIILVLAVIFRFFPVMISDYKRIKNALKMKGIGTSKFYYVRHPIQFVEYIFVPYVIISTNIANELALSCICRGLEENKQATSIVKLKFKIQDYIFIIIFLLILIFVIYKERI